MDPEGRERHRFVGYLPADDFLAQLHMGEAKAAFARKDWTEAERRFRDIVQKFPKSDTAPEALYWAGVSRYKSTNDHHVLNDTAQRMTAQYPQTSWAKRASVWLPKAA